MWNLCDLAVLRLALSKEIFFFQLGAIQYRDGTTCDGVMEKANLLLYTARAFPSVREHKTVYH